jgi:hypothetical protein
MKNGVAVVLKNNVIVAATVYHGMLQEHNVRDVQLSLNKKIGDFPIDIWFDTA